MTLPLSGGDLDRATARRSDEEWLGRAWADPTSRLLVVDAEGRVAVAESEAGPRLVLGHPPGGGAEPWLIGVDPGGVAYFASPGRPPRRAGDRLAGLRDVGGELPEREAALFATAVALSNWHASHPHCPRCGAPTVVAAAGFARRCPQDGSQHFPRTDPAVIVLVSDGGTRALLGRRAGWPAGRYSTLAGFVEAGEAAEAAVAREVREESGAAVHSVTYVASQPWPFPSSLMLGFTAQADPAEPVGAVDGELADVRWFDREAVRSGQVRLPPPVSIAYRLISGWLDGAPG